MVTAYFCNAEPRKGRPRVVASIEGRPDAAPDGAQCPFRAFTVPTACAVGQTTSPLRGFLTCCALRKEICPCWLMPCLLSRRAATHKRRSETAIVAAALGRYYTWRGKPAPMSRGALISDRRRRSEIALRTAALRRPIKWRGKPAATPRHLTTSPDAAWKRSSFPVCDSPEIGATGR